MLISQIQACLVKLQQRAVGLSMFLLLIINSVLLGALLYVVLPQYDMTFSERDMMRRITAISTEFEVDVANVWKVQLASNSRTYVGSYVRLPADQRLVDIFTSAADAQTFTGAIPPEAASAIMNGNSYCADVFGKTVKSQSTQAFREKIGAKQICWVPILSSHAHANNHIIGYVAFIWKEMIDQEQLAVIQARSLGMVNER
jgi:hypothetical protein